VDGGSETVEEVEVPIPTRRKGTGGKKILESERGEGEGESPPLPSGKRISDEMGIIPHEAKESQRKMFFGLSETRAVE